MLGGFEFAVTHAVSHEVVNTGAETSAGLKLRVQANRNVRHLHQHAGEWEGGTASRALPPRNLTQSRIMPHHLLVIALYITKTISFSTLGFPPPLPHV